MVQSLCHNRDWLKAWLGVTKGSCAISDSAEGAASVFAIDMDKDSDIDILLANYIGDQIIYYENIKNKLTVYNKVFLSINP